MFVGLAFVTGWTVSLYANNNGINSGLVKALNSVGQNLFGATVFGASEVSVTDVDDMPAVQLDLLDASPNPVLVNVFRGDTCQTYAQVRVGPGGTRMIIDPEVIPGTASLELEMDYGLSEAFPPGPCYPPDPILPPGGDV